MGFAASMTNTATLNEQPEPDFPASSPVTTGSCFHCGLPVPSGIHFSVTWNGAARALCCHGCEAVAGAIIAAGLGNYYSFRTQAAPTGQELVPQALHKLATYDHPAIQRHFVRVLGTRREAALILEGITCAACIWLNEQHLRRLPGVLDVQVNYTTRRAQVTWDERHISLSQILAAIQNIGYRAHPFNPAHSQTLFTRERHTLLRRLGVAGIFGAQVMTLSVALYVGDWSGSDPALRGFFHWISLLLTAPVLVYSAQPFFRGAWNDLRHGRAGMDTPVALGLGVAFIASLWATLTGRGTIYFDAVTMFTFLLLGGRYLEWVARARASEAAEALVQAVPALATRIDSTGDMKQVAVVELRPGDTVLVRPGENLPADGVVLDGCSSINESLLTGENLPLAKQPGDTVIGGSINNESPLTVRVENTGPDTILSAMLRLLERAQSEKPRLAQLADRVAAWFVVGVLALAALVGLYWWQQDAARVLPIVIAVLVVTCPCALGLATPIAMSVATGTLTRLGLLATRGHALETLARVTHFVFDKTGTLTEGKLRVRRTIALAALSHERALAFAAALERHSEHPIARAILDAAPPTIPATSAVINHPGEGLDGNVDEERLYIGTPAFIAQRVGLRLDAKRLSALREDGGTVVVLASKKSLLAAFVLDDTLRAGAVELIDALTQQGKDVTLLTGDHAAAARHIALAAGISTFHAELKPADKLVHLQRLQQQGAIVAMIGDGVNDAPVLAAAQVSIAMGGAAHISSASADMILLCSDLRRLAIGLRIAQRTRAVIRQNLAWAVAYNLLAVPAAAAGLITPWIAALGMSMSSLLVVANALRLGKDGSSPWK